MTMHIPDSAEQLATLIPRLAGKPVLVVGDVMLDHFVFGKVSRISPEAPVPVVHVTKERHELGGAGNVARNIQALGGKAHILSVVGQDADGETVAQLLEHEGITADLHRLAARPTTKKTRIIAHNQQVVRVDAEVNSSLPQQQEQQFLERLKALLPQYPVVILSDYGKGVITSGLVQVLHEYRETADSCKVLVDPKVSNFSLYTGVDLLTPNTSEAEQASGLLSGDDPLDLARVGHALFKMLRCRHLLITLGPRGMAFFHSPGRILHIPTVAKNVYDVTGAGDTVISVVALGLAAGLPMLESCLLANFAAGLVVGQVGTASVGPDQLTASVLEEPFPMISPILDED